MVEATKLPTVNCEPVATSPVPLNQTLPREKAVLFVPPLATGSVPVTSAVRTTEAHVAAARAERDRTN